MSNIRVVILGVPGAGKGTQARRLAEKLGLSHVITSAVIKDTLRTLSPDEQDHYQEILDRGDLLPSDVVAGWLVSHIQRIIDAGQGIVLDGSPRSVHEAEELERFGVDWSTFRVILLDIPDEEARRRMENRLECLRCRASFSAQSEPDIEQKCGECGGTLASRENETPEVITHRLERYHSDTEPVVKFFEQKGVLERIDGQPSIEDVSREVLAVFGVTP